MTTNGQRKWRIIIGRNTNNIALHCKDTSDEIMDTREPMRLKGDFVTVENKTRENITEEDKYFYTCSIERLYLKI